MQDMLTSIRLVVTLGLLLMPQKEHERAKFGYSRPEVDVAANEQRQRSKEVYSYASSVDRVKGGLKVFLFKTF